MKMYQVDAFSNEVFKGNPAAVLLLDQPMDDALMQNIAAENNLAETAFALPLEAGGWHLRWFTPTQEVDFCGHATLATAHVLIAHQGCAGPLQFDTRVGRITVTEAAIDRAGAGQVGYQLDLPRFAPEPLEGLPPEIAETFAVEPQALFRNFENLFVVLQDEATVRGFEPDLPAMTKLGRLGVVVTAQADAGPDADFVSRYFAPGAGIPEDPVTGSTHSTLVPYWAGVLGTSDLLAYQASKRGGWLQCTDTGERVWVRGQAVTYMAADITLPVATD